MRADLNTAREAIEYLHGYAVLPVESPPIEAEGQREDGLAALDGLLLDLRQVLRDVEQIERECGFYPDVNYTVVRDLAVNIAAVVRRHSDVG